MLGEWLLWGYRVTIGKVHKLTSGMLKSSISWLSLKCLLGGKACLALGPWWLAWILGLWGINRHQGSLAWAWHLCSLWLALCVAWPKTWLRRSHLMMRSAVKSGAYLTLFLPWGEYLSPCWAVGLGRTWRIGDVDNVKLSFLPSWMHFFSNFCAPPRCCHLLPRVLSSCDGIFVWR